MTGVVSRLTGLAQLASQRWDVVVAIFMMTAVVMIFIPLPTELVDVLIAINLALSILTLVVAFYITHPVEFSALPAIILLGVMFRLALSITTTRLILLQADAGQIVATFGSFVIGGEVVVGIVVFLIITTSQFIVITKGAERVAEVAARFTLDAMPGKQMSIDSDLRSGDIQQDEARARRARLERESQLYGAMDGAMKFVKGDAIASIVIVFINLIGGLLIGMLQRGMNFADAAHTYSLLTVGDGLIAQIPSLLVAVSASTLVTRVSSDVSSDLGSEIARQLGSSDRAMALAALILLAAGFIPGFPMVVFFALAAFLGSAAFVLRRRKLRTKPPAHGAETAALAPTDQTGVATAGSSGTTSGGSTRYRVVAVIGPGLAGRISPDQFRIETDRVRQSLLVDLGIDTPAVEMRPDQSLAPDRFRINLERVPVMEGDIPAGSLLLQDDPTHLDLLQVPYQKGAQLLKRRPSIWVDSSHGAVMREAGIGFLEGPSVFTECLAQVLRRYAAHFIGIQETRELLNAWEADHPELVKEALNVVTLKTLSEILRRLVEEEVSINSLRIVLEAVVEWGGRKPDALLLVERARVSLGRQICHRYAQLDRVVVAYTLSRSAEDAVRTAMTQTKAGVHLALPEAASRSILGELRREVDLVGDAAAPTVLVSGDIRRAVRGFLLRNEVQIPVLSYEEIAPEFSVQTLASIGLSASNAVTARTQRAIQSDVATKNAASPTPA